MIIIVLRITHIYSGVLSSFSSFALENRTSFDVTPAWFKAISFAVSIPRNADNRVLSHMFLILLTCFWDIQIIKQVWVIFIRFLIIVLNHTHIQCFSESSWTRIQIDHAFIIEYILYHQRFVYIVILTIYNTLEVFYSYWYWLEIHKNSPFTLICLSSILVIQNFGSTVNQYSRFLIIQNLFFY